MESICEHGKHKGKPWSQVPDDYLKWMIEVSHSQAQIAKDELARRETDHVEVVLSPLAIDRASLYLNATWQRTHNRNEGIYSWLLRMARAALRENNRDERGQYQLTQMRFAFERLGNTMMLKSVSHDRNT